MFLEIARFPDDDSEAQDHVRAVLLRERKRFLGLNWALEVSTRNNGGLEEEGGGPS